MTQGRTFSSLVLLLVFALVLGSAPADAFRMIQNNAVGRVTAGFSVACDDPGGFTHWTTDSIDWWHNTALQGSGKAAALQSAMASWTNVTAANHTLSYAGTTSAGWATDGVNTLLWANGNGCTGSCLALTALVLQPGQVIVESDITFNNNVTWNTNGSNFDTEAVAAHELGHSLGIHHTDLATAPQPTMTGTYFGSGGRSLEADDVAALRCSLNRYPVGGSICPAAGPPAFDALGTILTPTAMQNVGGTCRPHLGDFNGDDRTDVLRSCDSAPLNALFYGAPSGFSAYGYLLTGSVLQNSADSCRLHLGDFNGDTRTDLLRSCNDSTYNYLWHGSGGGFVGQGYVLTGSVLQNSADNCRLHLGDFNGDTRTDLLRSCDTPGYNYLWRSGGSGFTGLGYVLTGSTLQNQSGTCRVHVADFDGDLRDDVFRTCDDSCFNFMFRGTPTGNLSSHGYTVQNSVLQYANGACRLQVGDFSGDDRADAFRTCNDPNFNALWQGIP